MDNTSSFSVVQTVGKVTRLALAHVSLGGVHIGIPLTQVRQVLPWPEQLQRLPRRDNELLGVFMYRGHAIPLVDLHAWLGTPQQQAEKSRNIIVLRQEKYSVAFAIDALYGLKHVEREQIQRIYSPQTESNSAEDFFHSVVKVEPQEQLLSLLDATMLMQRAQVWGGDTSSSTEPHSTGDGENQQLQPHELAQERTEPHALLRVGSLWFAVPAQAVGEVLARPQHDAVFGMASSLLGMSRWREHDLPIIDLAKRANQPCELNDCPLLLVLQDAEQHTLGVPVSEICAVQRFPTKNLQPITHSAEGTLFSHSVILDNGERIFLLDISNLFTTTCWAALSKTHKATKKTDNKPALLADNKALSSTQENESYLVFEAAGQWAIPLHEVCAVLPLPTLYKSTHSENDVVARCEWRNIELPVIDLRPQDKEHLPTPRMMVVKINERHAGLIVDNVCALLPRQHNLHLHGRMAGTAFHMITLTQGEQRSYHVKKLAELPFFKATKAA